MSSVDTKTKDSTLTPEAQKEVKKFSNMLLGLAVFALVFALATFILFFNA